MNIQTKYKNIGDNACLIFCYMFETGLNMDSLYYEYEHLVNARVINSDCYINDADSMLYILGCKHATVKRGVNPNGNTIIPFVYGKNAHFVVIGRDKKTIVFNSLDSSKCVDIGKLDFNQARFIEWF